MRHLCLATKVPSIDARELWMEDWRQRDMLQHFVGTCFFFSTKNQAAHILPTPPKPRNLKNFVVSVCRRVPFFWLPIQHQKISSLALEVDVGEICALNSECGS